MVTSQEVLNSLAIKGTVAMEDVQANASGTVTISNVAPAGVGTATITKWLKITQGGTVYYIPMWT